MPRVAAVLVGLALLGGCSAGSSSSGSAGSRVVGQAKVDAGGARIAEGAAAGPAAGPVAGPAAGTPSSDVVVADQKLVRTATLRLRLDDVTAGAADVRAIAVGTGGSVTSEDLTTQDTDGSVTPAGAAVGRETTGTMTIDVPSARLDAALDQLTRLGTVLDRTTSTQDVTRTYVDTASRIATMTTSIDRVRALMSRATAIDQIVALETELSRREADLESLQAQLNALDQQTVMSTISLSLASPGTVVPPAEHGSGFVYGLTHGWSAFVAFLRGLLTVVGAALPFVATLALLGTPAVLWWRRRSGAEREPVEVSRYAADPSAPAPAPAPAPAVQAGVEDEEKVGSEATPDE